MTYELFFYRRQPGRSLREVYLADISTPDHQEALEDPSRIIDRFRIAAAFDRMGFKRTGSDDAFGFDPHGEDHSPESITLYYPQGHAAGSTVTLWECHMSLAVPLGEQHSARDEELAGLLRRVCLVCHDHNLMGYDPRNDRELTPATINQVVEEIAVGDMQAKPWWKTKLW